MGMRSSRERQLASIIRDLWYALSSKDARMVAAESMGEPFLFILASNGVVLLYAGTSYIHRERKPYRLAGKSDEFSRFQIMPPML